MSLNKATACGFLAIVLWSSIIGLMRSVAESFGPTLGAACIYTLGSVLLLIVGGLPRVRGGSLIWFIVTGILFVAYELCLSLSIGLSHNNSQAIEVSMLNYLWPSFTILFAIIINKQRSNLWIIPGSLMAIFGIGWILSGNGFSLLSMRANVAANPLSYGLAFSGAIIWALYCNLTRRFASGQNGIALFFAMTAVSLWSIYLFSQNSVPDVKLSAWLELISAAVAIAAGYGFWNIGIMRGNMALLATASYFTPVLSAAFAAFWLGNRVGWQFWQGTALITGGSLLCWWATRNR